MDNQGWIALPRNIIKSWLWENPRKLKMWLKLVMMANWEDSSSMIGNSEVIIRRGQIIRSIPSLASELGCSKQTAQTFLEVLEKSSLIKKEIEKKTTKITILKYDEYSPLLNKKRVLHASSESIQNSFFQNQEIGRKLGTSKEYNKIKKEKNIKIKKGIFYEELKNEESFWKEWEQRLSLPKEQLIQMAETFFHEMPDESSSENFRKLLESHFYKYNQRCQSSEINDESNSELEYYSNLILNDSSWVNSFCVENNINKDYLDKLLMKFRQHCISNNKLIHENLDKFKVHFVRTLKYIEPSLTQGINSTQKFPSSTGKGEQMVHDYSDTDFGGRKY